MAGGPTWDLKGARAAITDDVSNAASNALSRLAKGGHAPTNDKVAANIARLGMSDRQRELDARWQVFCGTQYDHRPYDWDGLERVSTLDEAAIGTGPALGQGFIDHSNHGQNVPLRARKPCASYHLAAEVVERFTAKLFSERNHPKLVVPHNAAAEDWVHAIVEQGRLWSVMREARNIGGAMGSVPIGFELRDGVVVFEAHDPRWTVPTWKDRHAHKMASVETRWMFDVDERAWDPKLRAYVWVRRWYWYRRVIDAVADTLYEPCLVSDDPEAGEPVWVVKRAVEHGFGFVPIVWVQNEPVHDDPDGVPDCALIFDKCADMDVLLSQASRGTKYSCDPTFYIADKAQLDGELQKGSGAGLSLTESGKAGFIEPTGSGPKLAVEIAREFRDQALEVVRCVIESGGKGGDAGPATATEIRRRYDSMEARIDNFREQYGQVGVLPLVRMVIAAVQKLAAAAPVVDEETGAVTKPGILLPDRAVVVESEDGVETVTWEPRQVPSAERALELQLKWPPYERPTGTDVKDAVTAAAGALAGKLIDAETAVKYVAPFFGVEEPAVLVKALAKKAAKDAAAQDSALMDGMQG